MFSDSSAESLSHPLASLQRVAHRLSIGADTIFTPLGVMEGNAGSVKEFACFAYILWIMSKTDTNIEVKDAALQMKWRFHR